jgi:ABC-type multidrug transport system ATPase subunit
MICDMVGILLGGRLVRVGRLDELLGTGVESIEVTAVGLLQTTLGELAGLAMAPPLVQGERAMFRLRGEGDVDKLVRRVLEAGGRIAAVTPQKQSLEELFLAEVRGGMNR